MKTIATSTSFDPQALATSPWKFRPLISFNGFRHLTKSAISAKWSQTPRKSFNPSVFLPLPFRELLEFLEESSSSQHHFRHGGVQFFELLTPWFAPETTLRNLAKRIQTSTATTPCNNSFRGSSVSLPFLEPPLPFQLTKTM